MKRITDDNKQSRSFIGICKVMDRQQAKEREVKIDLGMQTFKIYNNKQVHECEGLMEARRIFLWQPLKYVVHKIPHTTYTYEISKMPMAQDYLRRAKNRHKRNIQHYASVNWK